MYNRHIYSRIFFVLFCSAVFFMAGCTKSNYKSPLDKQVYKDIDSQWRSEFGSRTNYRVSDTTPAADSVQVARAVPDSGIISVKDAVALATAYNRQYQLEKEKLYRKALDLRLSRYEFERKYFGNVTAGYSSDPNEKLIGAEARFGFNQLLTTGTRVSVAVTNAWVNVLSGNLKDGFATVLSATVTQPLLRGRNRMVVLESLTQAQRDLLYQVRQFNRFRKTFVVSVITQYYYALEQLDKLNCAQDNRRKLEKIKQRAEILAKAGKLPVYELDRIKQEILKAGDVVVELQRQYAQALDELKIMLALPVRSRFQLDVNELKHLRKNPIPDVVFSESDAVDTALFRRLDLASRADMVIDAQRKVAVAVDDLRAALNVVGSADVVSSRKADRSNMGSLGNKYGLGLELDLPMNNVPQQNVYRKALLTLNQRRREYDLTADKITLQVRNAYRDLTQAGRKYKIYSDSLQLAEKRLRKTSLLVQYGKASTRRILSAQNDYFKAQTATAQALIDYTTATLKFYRDSGVLTVNPDGMWQLNKNNINN